MTHSIQCFTTYLNTFKFVKNTPLRVVFSNINEKRQGCDQTVFDTLCNIPFPRMSEIVASPKIVSFNDKFLKSIYGLHRLPQIVSASLYFACFIL